MISKAAHAALTELYGEPWKAEAERIRNQTVEEWLAEYDAAGLEEWMRELPS